MGRETQNPSRPQLSLSHDIKFLVILRREIVKGPPHPLLSLSIMVHGQLP